MAAGVGVPRRGVTVPQRPPSRRSPDRAASRRSRAWSTGPSRVSRQWAAEGVVGEREGGPAPRTLSVTSCSIAQLQVAEVRGRHPLPDEHVEGGRGVVPADIQCPPPPRQRDQGDDPAATNPEIGVVGVSRSMPGAAPAGATAPTRSSGVDEDAEHPQRAEIRCRGRDLVRSSLGPIGLTRMPGFHSSTAVNGLET